MKINAINNNYNSQTNFCGWNNKTGDIVADVGVFAVCTILGLTAIKAFVNEEEISQKELSGYKEYIQKTDSDKYNKIINSDEYQRKFVDRNEWGETSFWKEQAKAVEDSMRIDGIAKKAYMKAMQENKK